MAVFTFDKVNDYVQEDSNNSNKINFLKLQDDGWYAKVRFMYGPGETFTGFSVHNVAEEGQRQKYVPCLREPGQPLDSCPLCNAGNKVIAQYFIPVYVISIVSNVRGVTTEQPVNDVYLFQRGKTFSGMLSSVVRQCNGTPMVNNIFNIVRSGKAGDMKTTYLVEFVGRDETTLQSLPARPEIMGSYLLPSLDYNTMMEKYVHGNVNSSPAITPRTIQTGNVGYVVPQQTNIANPGVAPAEAPRIPF